MKRDELMYDFASASYKESFDVRKDIRDKCSFIFGIGVPVLNSIAALSLSTEAKYPVWKYLTLGLSAALFIVSVVLFLLVFVPSSQITYLPSTIGKEVRRDLPNPPPPHDKVTKAAPAPNEALSEKRDDSAQAAFDATAFNYFSVVYSNMTDEFEKTNKHFRKITILFIIFLCLSLVVSVASFLL
jgi:hypothetical protein